MKAKFIAVLFLILMVCSFPVNAHGKELSYGIGVIRKEVSLRKCCASGEAAEFSPDEFEDALGIRRISAISVSSLPDKALGKLKLGEKEVYAGQIIPRAEIESLAFVPSGNGEYSVSFGFCDAKDTSCEYVCTVCLIADGNKAPVAKEEAFSTQKNIELIKTLKAEDPEGDLLVYGISAGTKKGRVRLLDKKAGVFSYIPDGGYTGKDSFTYTVCDSHGNLAEAEVTLNVEKPACDVFYSDMDGSAAHNSAIKLAAAGIMTGEKIGGVSYFYPTETVKRADFLRLCMQAAGTPINVTEVYAVSFADADLIKSYDKPYIDAAVSAGIVNTRHTAAGTVFAPDEPISFAEAGAIVKKLTGKDADILCGDTPITRADAAEMLCMILES